MKHFLLSTLLCLVGYTGAYASNEVTENMFISEEIEMIKSLDAMDLEVIQSEQDYNCTAELVFLDWNGQEIHITVRVHADGEADCYLKIQDVISVYLSVGFVLIDHTWQFTP